MGNVLRIFKRDVLRLIKAPAALVVVVALMVLPSLYTWYNVLAFWDPYNSTGGLQVRVVNQDLGADNELTGKLNVGESVTEGLLGNDKLDFVESGYDEAIEELKAGHCYAVYVLPEDFSECLISPVTGKVKSPHITYYVNEKLGPVSPKITDAAASTIEQTVNSTFVATVSDFAVQAIDKAIDDAQADVDDARSVATARVSAAKAAIEEVHGDLVAINEATVKAKKKTKSASAAMDGAGTLTEDARAVLGDISRGASSVQSSLSRVSALAAGSLPSALSDVSQVAAKASSTADGLLADAQVAEDRIDTVVARLKPVINTMNAMASELRRIANALNDTGDDGKNFTSANAGAAASTIKSGASKAVRDGLLAQADKIQSRADKLQSIVDKATSFSKKVSRIAKSAAQAADSLESSTQQASSALEKRMDDLFGTAIPAISSSLSQVEIACASLSSATTSLDSIVKQAQAVLKQLGDVLDDCGEAVTRTDALISRLQDDLVSIMSDARLLASSDAIAELVANGTLNSKSISEFMGAPTELKTVEFFHLNAYGAAMAPLFMNLTFWIGAFMLVVICRLEVDDEGIKKPTFAQRYLARFLLFAVIAVIQAVICCVGVLAMGVQAANPAALFVASAFASLAYLSVIYALSATLHHIGKALCIVLVFAQIPGGSGLYPMELTPGFYQAIHPFLPFSYGIDAMREAIGGFYGNYFTVDLAILALIFLGMTLIGIAVVPLMSNVTHMASRQIREGDLYNGEDTVAPARPYRLSQVVHALADRDDYRASLERRYAQFSRRYPIFIRASIVLGIVVPVAIVTLMALDAAEKVTLLTIMLVSLVTLMIFLVIVESLRYSFERQLSLEEMSSKNVLRTYFDRERMVSAISAAKEDVSGAGEDIPNGAEGVAGNAVDDSNGGAGAPGGAVNSSNSGAGVLGIANDAPNDREGVPGNGEVDHEAKEAADA